MKNFIKFRVIGLLSIISFSLIFLGFAQLQSSPASDDEIEVEGLIQAIGSDNQGTDSITVNNLDFYVDANTEIKGEHGSSLSFSDLQVGDFVEVEADILQSGKFLATKIEVENDNHFNEFEVEGHIDSLGNDNVFVGGQEFAVTSQTQIRGEHGAHLTFADLRVGMFVEIKALIKSDGSFWAKRIKIEDEDNHDFEFTGIIDSVGTDNITISGFTVAVDSNTQIIGDNHQLLTLSDLMVGLRVEVKAKILNDGSLLAVHIKIEDDFENEIEITGAIDTVYSNVIVVSGFEFWIDSNTVVFDHHRNPIMFSDLQIGMIVEVKGFLQNDGSVYAVRIKIEDFWRHDIEFEGVIDSIGTNWLRVLGNKVYTDSNTVILDSNRNPINFADLTVGTRVEVKAFLQNNGRLLASRIKIEDNGGNQLEIHGIIDSLTASSIFVSGTEFIVDGQTQVLNHANIIISFVDLQIGMFVEIKAFTQSNGSLLAVKIKIEDNPGFINSTGIVSGISSQSIMVSNLVYQIDATTVVLDSLYQLQNITDLTLGSEVKIWVDTNNGSNPIALQIKMEPEGTLTTVVTDGQKNSLPVNFELGQNYPNPFNPSTTIPVAVNEKTNQVTLIVYNVLGQKVKTIFNGILQNGNYQFTWNGNNTIGLPSPSGVYFYKLTVGTNQSQIKRMLLIK